MRAPVNENQVRETFETVASCLEAIEEHGHLAREANRLDPGTKASDPVRVPSEAVAMMVGSVRRLQSCHESAAPRLRALDWDLPALTEAPITHRGTTGSSWAETTVLLAGRLAEDVDEWTAFDSLPDERKRYLFRVALTLTEALAPFRPSLKIEGAKLLDRARTTSPDVMYAYEFQNLKPQARRLFRLLTRHRGRRISYQEIAVEVCDDEGASNVRIQRAMSRLRDELVKMGSGPVAESIQSEEGGYLLR